VEALKGSRTLLSGEEKRAIRLEKRQAQAEKQRAKRVARKETLKKRKAEEISAPNNFRGATFSDDEEPSAEVIAKKQRNLASQGVVTKKTKADVHDKTPTGVDSSDGEDDDAFEFSHMAQGADVFTKDKKGRKLTKGKALRKAVGQKERLDKLAASNPEKYKEEKKRIEMQKSLQRLHGARIIDDPKILAKQIKRIVKKKEKSLAKKEDEKQALIDHHASRQRKREANLKARKTKGKNRAEHRRTDIRRAQASLGKRPGFEGQGGFLN
jgi:hypothetical protein